MRLVIREQMSRGVRAVSRFRPDSVKVKPPRPAPVGDVPSDGRDRRGSRVGTSSRVRVCRSEAVVSGCSWWSTPGSLSRVMPSTQSMKLRAIGCIGAATATPGSRGWESAVAWTWFGCRAVRDRPLGT